MTCEHWTSDSSNVVTLKTDSPFSPRFTVFLLLILPFDHCRLYLPEISLRCKLKVFSGLFWAFSWACAVTFQFSSYMQLFMNVLVFKIWLLTEEKAKNEVGGKRRYWPFKSPGSHFNQMGSGLQQSGRCNSSGYPPFCLLLCDQKQQAAVSTDLQYLADRVPFALWLPQQDVPGTGAQLPATWRW